MIATLLTVLALSAPASIHVKVDGDGYLRFAREGRAVYAKEAKLVVANGVLASQAGPTVLPSVPVQGSPSAVEVDLEGRVYGVYSGSRRALGRLVLALFAHDEQPVERDGFMVSAGRPRLGNPGEGLNGVVRLQGAEPPVRVVERATAPAPKATPPAGIAPKVAPVVSPEPRPAANASNGSTATAPLPTEAFLRKGGVQIVLNEGAEVDGSTYTLGEIATVYAKADLASKLTGIDIGSTPPLGVEARVDRVRIKARLKQAGINSDEYVIVGAPSGKVKRRGQRVTQEAFQQQAIAAAQAKLGPSASLVGTTPGPDMTVPMGDLSLVAESTSVSGTQVSVVVAAFVDGKRINSRTIKLSNQSPIATVKMGATVKVRASLNGATVETTGRVKSVDPSSNQVVVVTENGATLIGTPASGGIVEVKL